MNQRFCAQCGHEHPPEARFCMNCGTSLSGEVAPEPRHAVANSGQREGTDWAAIVAGILAFLSLKHMTRKARNTTIVLVFLFLFFGCPMLCGFVSFGMQWFASLIR